MSTIIYTVYKHTNTANGKCYIGITSKSIQQRLDEHIIFSNNHSNFCFHAALKKYGVDSFISEILYQSKDLSHTKQMERWFIIENQSFSNCNGYNMTYGGEGIFGNKHTEKSKLKMSQSHKGKYHSEDTKNKISASNRKRIISNKTKLKMSKSLRGKNHPLYGKHHTEETKRKLSKNMKGKKHKLVECPHCNKRGGQSAMTRWHFDNCKFITA